MKIITLIILLLSTTITFGQSDFSSLVEKAQNLSVPYNSQYDNEKQNKRKVLTQNDSVNLLSKLISTRPTIVNEIVSSPFGQLDCTDIEECLDFDNIHEIAIIGYIKVNSNNYLLHVTITPKREYAMSKGILISMNIIGELNDWFFADLGTSGNHNGNVSRSFKIDKDNKITVSESSWGRNNINYSLEVEYKVFRFSENKDIGNDEDEYNDYHNRENNKIEYFELKDGKFELTKLCLDI
jgi:hypothetical protein